MGRRLGEGWKGEDCSGMAGPAPRRGPRSRERAALGGPVASARCLPGGAGPKRAGAGGRGCVWLGEGEAQLPAVEGDVGGGLAEVENQPGGGSSGPWEMSSIDPRAPDTHMYGICPFS